MDVLLENITKSYKGRTVLDIPRLEFKRGKIYSILGPNGSGKTTLLRIIFNIEKADSGTVSFPGNSAKPVAGEMAFLLQMPYLFDLSVLDNVMLGICSSRRSFRKNDKRAGGAEIRGDAKMMALEALDRVGLKDFANARAVTLSGGEAQKVALARTFVSPRKLVLLDEPTASVDISSIKMIEDYIKEVNMKHKTTIILTTHNPFHARRIADEAIILWKGRVIERGKPDKILTSPEKEETKQFLENWEIRNR